MHPTYCFKNYIGVGRGRERERERCSPFIQAVQIYPDLPLTEPVGRYILD